MIIKIPYRRARGLCKKSNQQVTCWWVQLSNGHYAFGKTYRPEGFEGSEAGAVARLIGELGGPDQEFKQPSVEIPVTERVTILRSFICEIEISE